MTLRQMNRLRHRGLACACFRRVAAIRIYKAGQNQIPMKIRAIVAVAVMASSTSLLAESYTWRPGDVLGGAGTWNTTTANWNTGPQVTWPTTGTNNEAVFEGTAGTVTTSGAVTANRLRFNTGGYTVASGSLTLTGGIPTIAATTGTTTISSRIVGSGADLTKSGTGTLTLTGSNTYSGATRVTGGRLVLGSGGRIYESTSILVDSGTLSVANNDGHTLRIVVNGTIAAYKPVTLQNGGVLSLANTSSNFTGIGDLTFHNGGSLVNNGAAGEFRLFGPVERAVIVTGDAMSTINAQTALWANRVFDVANGASAVDLQVNGVLTNGSGTSSVTKTGAGTMQLAAVNAYTGATTVNAGTLLVSSAGSLNSSSAITVGAGGNLLYNSSTALTKSITLDGAGATRAILGGTGTISTALTLNNLGDTLSPGNSPGIQVFNANQAWNSFTYLWEVNDWGSTTAGTGFDRINITGGLTLNGAGSYALDITSLTLDNVNGNVANFTEDDRSWTILRTTTGITNFDANLWTLNTANFSSAPTRQGTFSLSQSGNDLVLHYAAVPEPSTYVLIATALTAFAIFRRRTHSAEG